MPQHTAESLTKLAKAMLQAAGVNADDAREVAEHLIDANLCGHDSHGLMRLPQYLQYLREGKYFANVPLTVINETPAVYAADANWGLGQVQAKKLLTELITRASAVGVAAGSLRRCGHIGRLGAYAEYAASRNLVFFGTVNTHGAGRRVAPPGGTEGRISTNPICFGAPTPNDPVVLDFGTSVAAEGKVRVYHQKNQPAPSGWLLDSTGQPTTNPSVLYSEPRGTILPFGGSQMYKGFGLGLLLDMLAGGLSGGECSHANAPMAGIGNAVLFTLYNPALFGGSDHFLSAAGSLASYVRSSPTTTHDSSITLPGDPERNSKQQRQSCGIDIPDGTWKLITDEAKQLSQQVESPQREALNESLKDLGISFVAS